MHSIDNNIFSAFEYAYICVFLVSRAGSLCLCAFLCVGMSFAHLFSILVERLLSIVSEMVWSLLVSLFHCPFISIWQSSSRRSSHCCCCSLWSSTRSIHAMVSLRGYRSFMLGVLNLAGLEISGCPVLMITLFFKKSFFLWKSPGSTSCAGLLVLQMIGSSFSRRLHLSSKHLNAYTWNKIKKKWLPPLSPTRIFSHLKHHCYRNLITECK